MKKKFTLIACGMTLGAFGLLLGSCSKNSDPTPETKAQLSFTDTETSVKESAGTVEFELKLDKAAPEDFTVTYKLSGTARDKATVAANTAYDYEVVGTHGEADFKKGETTAKIKIKFISDFYIEGYNSSNACTPETINIAIKDVDSDLIDITRDDEMDVSLEQEDGKLVILDWRPTYGEDSTYEDVDMDLILWIDSAGTLYPTLVASASADTQPIEFLFLPNAMNSGTYGFSYTYYAGTAEPMNFFPIFADVVNGAIEAEANQDIFNGTYSLANLNPYVESHNPVVLAQTFKIDNKVFKDYSSITVNETSSRLRNTFSKNKRVRSSDQSAITLRDVLHR